MPRIYRVPYTGTLTTSGGNGDLISIVPADDKPCRLAGWILGQSSEEGDAAEETLRVTLRHFSGTVTVGTGGSSVTPVKPDLDNDVAAGFTARCNDQTTVTSQSGGAETVLEELGWNIRNSPWERWIPEEQRPICRGTSVLVVRSEDTPTDDITIELTFFVEEL